MTGQEGLHDDTERTTGLGLPYKVEFLLISAVAVRTLLVLGVGAALTVAMFTMLSTCPNITRVLPMTSIMTIVLVVFFVCPQEASFVSVSLKTLRWLPYHD